MKFKGIMPALVTPLNSDGKTVNEKVSRELIEYLLKQGADGFYVLGSTGEGIILPETERMKLLEICVDQVGKRKPIICHTASMDFNEAVRLSKHAEVVGADAVSAIPPLFFHYGEQDIYNYYKTLATSTNLPFIMYNHPAANGGMTAETVAKMFEIDNVIGVKWTVNNYYQMMRLKDMTHGEMNIFNGPDEMLLMGLSAGADAGIGTTYNVMLPQFLEIYKYFNEGNNDKAREIQYKVNRVINCIVKNETLSSTKYMLKMLGFDVGQATYPLKQTVEKDLAYEELVKSVGWPFNDK